MKAIIPEKEAVKRKPEISKEKSPSTIDVKIDDTFSSIIVKKSENRVKESPLKKSKSTVPSELWLGWLLKFFLNASQIFLNKNNGDCGYMFAIPIYSCN